MTRTLRLTARDQCQNNKRQQTSSDEFSTTVHQPWRKTNLSGRRIQARERSSPAGARTLTALTLQEPCDPTRTAHNFLIAKMPCCTGHVVQEHHHLIDNAGAGITGDPEWSFGTSSAQYAPKHMLHRPGESTNGRSQPIVGEKHKGQMKRARQNVLQKCSRRP